MISLYDRTQIEPLDVKDLVLDENGDYRRNADGDYVLWLNGANNSTNNIFAKNITIKTTDEDGDPIEYVYHYQKDGHGIISYLDEEDNPVLNEVVLDPTKTYFITLTDIFDNKPSHRFNISHGEYIIVESVHWNGEGETKNYYDDVNGNERFFYAFTNTTLK